MGTEDDIDNAISSEDRAREVWERQLEDVQRALDAHIIRDGEWMGIDPTTAPPGLVDMHVTLIQIGYIRGWME